VKSVLIAAALCAAMVSVPAAAQAATGKLSDHDLYCSFRPLTSKCAPATPVKVVPKKTFAKIEAKKGLEVYACSKRSDGKPFLLSCWVK